MERKSSYTPIGFGDPRSDPGPVRANGATLSSGATLSRWPIHTPFKIVFAKMMGSTNGIENGWLLRLSDFFARMMLSFMEGGR